MLSEKNKKMLTLASMRGLISFAEAVIKEVSGHKNDTVIDVGIEPKKIAPRKKGKKNDDK